MKMVVAIIRPERLRCVQQAIKMVNADLMTVTETHSYGQGEGHTLIYRSSEIRVRSAPKLRVEILMEDTDAEEVVDAILHTGFSRNDGRIFVVSVDFHLDLFDSEHDAQPNRS